MSSNSAEAQSSEEVETPNKEQIKEEKNPEEVSEQEEESSSAAKRRRDEEALGSKPPLPTILHLSIGPILSQLVQSLYGLADSMWVSRSIGEEGLTALTIVLIVDFINISFSQFFFVAVSARVSNLFGRKMYDICPQVFVDILRVAWVTAIVIPAVLLPCAKPIIRWFGATESVTKIGFQYLIPQLGCCIVNYTYQSICGILQAQGRSILFGATQIFTCFMNALCFDPLYLLGFKFGLYGVSLGTISSQIIPIIVLSIMLFRGKFAVKPTAANFCRKIHPESWSALRVAVSSLISSFAGSLPFLLLQKFLTSSSRRIDHFTSVMASWNVVDRLYGFVLCIILGLNQSLLPSASFAYGMGRLERVKMLSLHALWVGSAWAFVMIVIIEAIPEKIGRIWSSDEKFLSDCKKMMREAFMVAIILPIKFVVITALQALKKVKIAIIIAVATILFPLPIYSIILYVTDKNNPVRLIYAFPLNDATGFLVVVITFFIGIYPIFKNIPSDQEVMEQKAREEQEKKEKKDGTQKKEEEATNEQENVEPLKVESDDEKDSSENKPDNEEDSSQEA